MQRTEDLQRVPTSCPSERLWGDFLAGTVDHANFELMSAHLGDCSTCERLLDKFFARSSASSKGFRSPFLQEPNYFRMIARIKEVQVSSEPADTVVDGSSLLKKQDDENEIPDTIGRFTVRGVLGTGGFGRVFLADDPLLNRLVAIKAPRQSELAGHGDVSSFLNEARHAASLDHPGIVPIFDVLADNSGRTLIVMKYIDGKPLSAMINQGGLEVSHAVRIAIQVARTIHYAHERGFIHRDLKPSNVLIDRQGMPHVSDLGLGLRLDQVDAEVRRGGTPAYMAPEQVKHDPQAIDRRSDVWALGVMLAELVHGRRPFPQVVRSELFEAITSREPILGAAPTTKSLDAIIRRCLAKLPEERYPTADSLAQELSTWLRRNYPTGIDRWRYGWRRNLMVAAVCGLAISGLALGRETLKQRELHSTLVQLESSPVHQVEKLIERLRSNGATVETIANYGSSTDFAGQFRLDAASLALGDQSDERVMRCVDALQSVEPPEIAVFATMVSNAAAREQLTRKIVARISPLELDAGQFSLSAALACLAPKEPRWSEIREVVAQRLVSLTDSELDRWLQLFDPIGASELSDVLLRLMNDPKFDAESQTKAARGLARYLESHASKLVEAIGHADPAELRELVLGQAGDRDQVLRCLRERFQQAAAQRREAPKGDWVGPTDRDLRSARFAIASSMLGENDSTRDALKDDRDPTLQTLVIHGLVEQAFDGDSVIELLQSPAGDDNNATAVQFAMLEVLAELPIDQPRSSESNRDLRELLGKLQLSPDAGVHSMAKLVAKRYGLELERLAPKVYGLWLVDPLGDGEQDFAIIEPCIAEVGIRDGQLPPSGTSSWPNHQRRFDRRIAVAMNEVTIEQFRALDPNYVDDFIARQDLMLVESAKDAAMMLVTQEAAYRFCNACSTKAGLESCYEPSTDIHGVTRLAPNRITIT